MAVVTLTDAEVAVHDAMGTSALLRARALARAGMVGADQVRLRRAGSRGWSCDGAHQQDVRLVPDRGPDGSLDVTQAWCSCGSAMPCQHVAALFLADSGRDRQRQSRDRPRRARRDAGRIVGQPGGTPASARGGGVGANPADRVDRDRWREGPRPGRWPGRSRTGRSGGLGPAAGRAAVRAWTTGPVRACGSRSGWWRRVDPGAGCGPGCPGPRWPTRSTTCGVCLPAQVRLLREMLRPAHESTGPVGHGYGYGYGDKVLYLDDVESRRVWDLLLEAQESGLPLVMAGKKAETVRVHPDPVVARLVVRRDGEDLVVEPLLQSGRTDRRGTPAHSAAPPHGIAWFPADDGRWAAPGPAGRRSTGAVHPAGGRRARCGSPPPSRTGS